MKWIFLSPHLDDVVFSCGGFIWEKAHQGDAVEIWTIFAGIPFQGALTPFAQSLHARWGVGVDTMSIRQVEDQQACSILGAAHRHFDFLDCVYRHFTEDDLPVVSSEEDLFQPAYHLEPQLLREIIEVIDGDLSEDAWLVGPLALGDHIDHQLVHMALMQINPAVCCYADYPYAGRIEAAREILPASLQKRYLQFISSAGLKAWQEAVAAYKTQISTFWDGIPEMEMALKTYWRRGGGSHLWSAA